MNPIVVCLCIFPTFVIFSLVSEGSETHVIMTEIKHVYVCLWDNVCVFALFFHCPKGTVPLQSIRNYVIGYMTVILLVKEGPYLSTALMWHQKIIMGEQNYGWLRAQSQLSACLSNWISMLLTLCLSAEDWNTFSCSRGIMRFKTFYIKN